MDHRPSQYLKPPSTHPHAHPQPRVSSSSSSTPRAPVTAHPTATIADAVVFQGPHPIAIGAETVIHPRVRIYSFDGPVLIGEGCIISEKSTIGAAPTPSSPLPSPTIGGPGGGKESVPTRISHSVTVASLATVLPGAHIHSSVCIDSLATIHHRANIGAHSKICAGCHVPAKAVIRDWTVVWGSGAGFGQRRKRATKAATNTGAAVQQQGQVLEGKAIEDARLVVLKKEREALVRLIGASAAGSGRRR